MAIIRPGTLHSSSKRTDSRPLPKPEKTFQISKVPFRTADNLVSQTTSEEEVLQVAIALFELTSNTLETKSNWQTNALLLSHTSGVS